MQIKEFFASSPMRSSILREGYCVSRFRDIGGLSIYINFAAILLGISEYQGEAIICDRKKPFCCEIVYFSHFAGFFLFFFLDVVTIKEHLIVYFFVQTCMIKRKKSSSDKKAP